MRPLVLLLLFVATFDPRYGQVVITWTQTSDAPTVLIGKFDRADVWSVIRINDQSHSGPQRAIDYDPHQDDLYVIAECAAADAMVNTCHTVASDIVAPWPRAYLPIMVL